MKTLLENTRRPDIVFRANGQIDISARASQLLGLKEGDVINILDDKGEYYLYVNLHAPINGHHEGMVYRSNHRGNHFRVYSRTLTKVMLNICGASDAARLTVADPIDIQPYGTVLPIITRRLLP